MEIDWNARPELLARIKLQSRIDAEWTGDDELLKAYTAAALAHIEQHCDCVLVESAPIEPNQLELSADIWQALYLLVAHWYSNREATVLGTGATNIPLGVERLLWYRKRF